MNPLGKAKWTVISSVLALWGFAAFGQLPAFGQQGGIIPAANRVSELDQPIAWMIEAKRNYSAVKDYSCILATQENVNGKLQEQNIIQLKMKTEPFSVHMAWLSPKKNAGQEVVFVAGKNNNKMRVKSTFLNGAGGFMSIDPNDKRVMQHSRHTIVEAGIGNMIDQCLSQWQKDQGLGKTTVKIEAYKCNDRVCHKIVLTRTEKNQAFYCHRTEIYLEKESKLPIRLDNFGWPTPGGAGRRIAGVVQLRQLAVQHRPQGPGLRAIGGLAASPRSHTQLVVFLPSPPVIRGRGAGGEGASVPRKNAIPSEGH